MPFFLIDFENVQPKALDRLRPGEHRIKVFLGQHQGRLMLELVRALQPFGSDAEYIQIQGSGPDAVDFHIAFYIGRLAAAHPQATFNIISKDRGFDPLVRHLGTLGIACQRLPEIPDSGLAPGAAAAPAAGGAKPARAGKAARVVKAAPKPAAKAVAKAAPKAVAKVAPADPKCPPGPAKVVTARAGAATVVARLKKMRTRPARLGTLRSSIRAMFVPALDDATLDAVLQSLQGSGKVKVSGTKVTYSVEA